MKVLWPTVKQSSEKLVRETKQAGDEYADVAARIIERHGADVHLPSGDGGEAPIPFELIKKEQHPSYPLVGTPEDREPPSSMPKAATKATRGSTAIPTSVIVDKVCMAASRPPMQSQPF
jgi:hypothetical protein